VPSDRVFGLIATFGFALSIICWAMTFFGIVPSEVIPTILLDIGVFAVGIPAALRSQANRRSGTKLRFIVPIGVILAVVAGAAVVFGAGLAGMAANPTPAAVDRLWFTLLSCLYGVTAGMLLLVEEVR